MQTVSIEWIVPDINLESDITFATELVDLQRVLSRWKLGWSSLWVNEHDRQEIATVAQQWCDRLQVSHVLELCLVCIVGSIFLNALHLRGI